jgi:hypothetical protein
VLADLRDSASLHAACGSTLGLGRLPAINRG